MARSGSVAAPVAFVMLSNTAAVMSGIAAMSVADGRVVLVTRAVRLLSTRVMRISPVLAPLLLVGLAPVVLAALVPSLSL